MKDTSHSEWNTSCQWSISIFLFWGNFALRDDKSVMAINLLILPMIFRNTKWGEKKPPMGIEPITYALRKRRSTVEPWWRVTKLKANSIIATLESLDNSQFSFFLDF